MALQFGTETSLAITAGGLVSAGNRSSAAATVGITTNIAQILLEVNVQTTSVAPAAGKQVIVYGYKSMDGTTYEGAGSTVDNVDGTDKALTAIGSPSNLVFLGTIQLNQGAVATNIQKVFEVTGSFGCIPPKWGIVLVNDAGTALGATVTASYREVHYT